MFQLSNENTQLEFSVKNGVLFLRNISFFGNRYINDNTIIPHSIVYLTGENYRGRVFNRCCELGENLTYSHNEISAEYNCKVMTIYENNSKISIKTVYKLFDNSSLITTRKEITNISDKNIVLEQVAPLVLCGVMQSEEDMGLPNYYILHNSHNAETISQKINLDKDIFMGLNKFDAKRPYRFSICENGTQTTNRYLPSGVFEKQGTGVMYFEMYPSGSWQYEFDMVKNSYLTLTLTGKTFVDNGWYKILNPGETYCGEMVSVCGGKDMDCILEQLTSYRRKMYDFIRNDLFDKVIYNNFMHNTFDHPDENNDSMTSDYVKQAGGNYYIIDAGWHDEGIDRSPTLEIGEWNENVHNYPSGLKKTLNLLEKKGLKTGLWVEIQSVGKYSKVILPEKYFFHINGIRTVSHGRYQLDFSIQEVHDYATKIIDKIVDKYDVSYIKIDYNQTQLGNDCNDGSLTEGVSKHVKGYHKWLIDIQKKYPEIIFESCSSGGMCFDPYNLSVVPIVSFSDMETYRTVPYTISNEVIALLPEQMGIWCMPVYKGKEKETTDESVIFNVINSLYGIMHLSSRLDYLTNKQTELLKEGIKYYKSIANDKKRAVPIMPCGFTDFSSDFVVKGIKTGSKIYLSIYNLAKTKKEIRVDLTKYTANNAILTYPERSNNKYFMKDGELFCELEPETARAFEITI